MKNDGFLEKGKHQIYAKGNHQIYDKGDHQTMGWDVKNVMG